MSKLDVNQFDEISIPDVLKGVLYQNNLNFNISSR